MAVPFGILCPQKETSKVAEREIKLFIPFDNRDHWLNSKVTKSRFIFGWKRREGKSM